MKEFIQNRTLELEDKRDFAAWMADELSVPNDPCLAANDAFDSAKNSL